jgi:hypothetical protein
LDSFKSQTQENKTYAYPFTEDPNAKKPKIATPKSKPVGKPDKPEVITTQSHDKPDDKPDQNTYQEK